MQKHKNISIPTTSKMVLMRKFLNLCEVKGHNYDKNQLRFCAHRGFCAT